jgi:hypothetical protein
MTLSRMALRQKTLNMALGTAMFVFNILFDNFHYIQYIIYENKSQRKIVLYFLEIN